MRTGSRKCSIDGASAKADDRRAMEPWIHSNARKLLGVFGRDAQVFEVYSAGDSGEGCEVILFTTASTGGRVPWTARVVQRDGLQCTVCTVGW
jgi:hypothetical protein